MLLSLLLISIQHTDTRARTHQLSLFLLSLLPHTCSHLGRYITCKETGKVLADATKPGDDEALTIEGQPDGRWALKTRRGYYLGGTGEKIDAYTKEIKADRLWVVQLAMHPQ